MVFSSAIFLICFLPITLLLYYLTDRKYKNYILLISSIIFYSWGAPKFVFILLASTFLDFYIVKCLYLAKTKKRKNLFLFLSIFINLGLLLYFKYANFFIENVNMTLNRCGIENVKWTEIILPIGISFYTFQTLTYSIDVYRNVHKPLTKVFDYIMYIIMFPQLIAGPIVRFNTVADQITDRKETIDDRILGFYRFIIGLAKKVLIANVMGAKADAIMAMDFNQIDATYAWIGLLAYTFQIYFDFSGYSDMAIGIGRMLGFKFPENFDNPYVSRNITEFWRRWHITLGIWMRDYLYIPLGGNKVKTKGRLFFNLGFVFLISGLWHGASWNFVAWGAFHGLFLILDRIFLKKVLDKIGKIPSMIFTFFVITMGWVIFRIENFQNAIIYYKKLFCFEFSHFNLNTNKEFFLILIIAVFFSFITLFKFGLKWQEITFYKEYTTLRYIIMFFVIIVLFIISLASITSSDFNPFIYFRF